MIEVGPGIFRPLLAVHLLGPSRARVLDGIVDTGSDRVLIPFEVARSLGLNPVSSQFVMKSATDDKIPCRRATVNMGLSRDSTRLYWEAEVAVAIERKLKMPH